jgi:hypothetical protein
MLSALDEPRTTGDSRAGAGIAGTMMSFTGTDGSMSRLVRLRRLCWSAILSHAPMVESVCALATEGMHATNGSLTSLCEMYRKLGSEHEDAATHLIAAISDSDVDDHGSTA